MDIEKKCDRNKSIFALGVLLLLAGIVFLTREYGADDAATETQARPETSRTVTAPHPASATVDKDDQRDVLAPPIAARSPDAIAAAGGMEPSDPAVPKRAIRTWSDSNGPFLEGEFVALDGGLITVRRADGKELLVRLASLSAADQMYVQSVAPTVPGPSQERSPAPDDKLRKWTDATGQFEIVGEFVALNAGNVIVRQADGFPFSAPLDRLSAIDQNYVIYHVDWLKYLFELSNGLRLEKKGRVAQKAPNAPPAPAAPAPGGPRTRFAMLADVYARLNERGESAQAGLSALTSVTQEQWQAYERAIQLELAATANIRAAIARQPVIFSGAGLAGGAMYVPQLEASDLRILMYRWQQQQLWLQTRQSANNQLAGMIGVHGAQLISLCDPFGRLPLTREVSAAKALEDAIAQQRGNATLPYLRLALGFERLHTKDLSAALNDFNKAESEANAHFPGLTAFCVAAQGVVLSRRGQYGDVMAANRLFARAASSDPAIAHLLHGHALTEQGNYVRATGELKLAKKFAPSAPFVHEAIARLLVKSHGNSGEALNYALEAVRLDHWNNWTLLDTLALTQAFNGNFAAALESEQKALALAPLEAAEMLQNRISEYQHQVLPRQ